MKEGNEMKKGLKILFGVLICIVMFSGALYYHFFVSMSSLPTGELIGEYASSSSDCSVRIYRCRAGATVADSIRGEIVLENGKTKTVYWAYRESEADMQWLDGETVRINGRILNVYRDKYDWRRER